MPDENKSSNATQSNTQQSAPPANTSSDSSLKAVQTAPVLTKVEFSSDQSKDKAEKRDGK